MVNHAGGASLAFSLAKGGAESSAAEEIAAKAELLDLMLAATNDGIVDIDLLTGESRYSRRWKYLLGFDDEDIHAGGEHPDLWRSLIHPDDIARVDRLLLDHVEQNWPFTATMRMRHRHGGYRHILCRATTRRDVRDRAQRLVLIFADVDGQIRGEEQQRALVLALPDTLFRVRRNGMILGVKLGEERSGSPFVRLTEGRELRECLGDGGACERIEAAIWGEGRDAVRSLHLTTSAAPGEAIVHELRIVRCSDDEAVCIVRDVTERHALEQRLQRAQKLEAVGQLAAGIAHEINTPMQYIGDNLAFARESVNELIPLVSALVAKIERGSEARLTADDLDAIRGALGSADFDYVRDALPRALESTLDGVNRVTGIVRAMKAFSHPGSGELEPSDLGKIIENTVTVAKSEWKYVATVELRHDPELPLVRCVPSEISQVLLNLIVNACHAISDVVGSSGEKGRLVIETKRHEGTAELRVTDTGAGIPEHVRAKIFDPFFTTKEVVKGTGQGLSMAHTTIVGRHHGTIHFETEVGRGTTFIVRLPLSENH
jgi:signal transduction histidine kinase